MSGSKIKKTPTSFTDEAIGTGGLWQVILYNDHHNDALYVVQCLRRIFGHNEQLAEKIMLEAHRRGRAIAEVEDREKAQFHKAQLQSCGLTTTVEPV
jgi:ATP-dependent Clp protease adaptor protein ClpS